MSLATPSRRAFLRRAATLGALLATTRQAAADRLPEGVTPEIESMIQRAVGFLVATQNRDGSWNNMGGYGSYPTAMTALAGLSLLMTGNTPTRGPHSRAITRARDFLISVAQRTGPAAGLIATPAEEGRSLHGHGFALLFLAECYGMEKNVATQRELHDVLTRGVRVTERSQSRPGGWLYTPNQEGDEGSVTVTQIQGLRACRNAGIHVNVSTIQRAVRYIELSANPDGGIRYSIHRGDSRPPITAAAVATLYNAGKYDSPLAAKCLAYCERTITVQGDINRSWGHYFYSHLYFAQARYQQGGREWTQYYRAISRHLAGTQSSDGSWMGDQVGTSYGTAIALIVLQLPYQFIPIFQR